MRFIYTRHAAAMLIERRIRPEWVERTVTQPDSEERDPSRSEVLRAFKTIAERGLTLRVAYERVDEETVRVITTFFDRKKRA